MIIKEHTKEGKRVIALCDNDLLGQTFEDGKIFLDLTSAFYQGKEPDLDALPKALESAAAINAVGKDSVSYLLENGFIEKEQIKKAKDVPFVQIFFM